MKSLRQHIKNTITLGSLTLSLLNHLNDRLNIFAQEAH